MGNLSEKELSLLVGGMCTQLMQTTIDVDNTNQTASCICTYNNSNVINNDNSVSGCRCVCIK